MFHLQDLLDALAASRQNRTLPPTDPYGQVPFDARDGADNPGYLRRMPPDLLANLARLSSSAAPATSPSPLEAATQSTQQEMANRLNAYRQAVSLARPAPDPAMLASLYTQGNPASDAAPTAPTPLPDALLHALYAAQQNPGNASGSPMPAVALAPLVTGSPMPDRVPATAPYRSASRKHSGPLRRNTLRRG